MRFTLTSRMESYHPSPALPRPTACDTTRRFESYTGLPSRLLFPAGSGALQFWQSDRRMWFSCRQALHSRNTLARPFFGFRRCTGRDVVVPSPFLRFLDRDVDAFFGVGHAPFFASPKLCGANAPGIGTAVDPGAGSSRAWFCPTATIPTDVFDELIAPGPGTSPLSMPREGTRIRPFALPP